MIDATKYTKHARNDRPTKTVTATLPPDLAERLDHAKVAYGFLPGDYIRAAIEQALDALEGETND